LARRRRLTPWTVSSQRSESGWGSGRSLNLDPPFCCSGVVRVVAQNDLLSVVAHVAPGGHPKGADPKRFALVAPYESDPTKWATLPWRNVYDHDGPNYRICGETLISRGGVSLPQGVVGVKTYRDVLAAYRRHPEAKSLGPNGRPCSRRTVGLLARRPVQALSVTHVGKEANLLDEIQAGLIGDEEQVLAEYADLRCDEWQRLVLPVLKEIPVRHVASQAGLAVSTVAELRLGRSRPQPDTRARLASLAVEYARSALVSGGIQPPRSDDALLACYLTEFRTGDGKTCACGCGKHLPPGRRRWYSESHRASGKRQRRSDGPTSP
jgi:hypothetical protein